MKDEELKKEIADLIEISKNKNANIPLIIADACWRGLKDGIEIAKEKAIEAIKQEK